MTFIYNIRNQKRKLKKKQKGTNHVGKCNRGETFKKRNGKIHIKLEV